MRIEIDGVEKGRLESHTHNIRSFFLLSRNIIYIPHFRSVQQNHLGSPPLGSLVGEFFTDGKAVPPMCNNHMMQSRTV